MTYSLAFRGCFHWFLCYLILSEKLWCMACESYGVSEMNAVNYHTVLTLFLPQNLFSQASQNRTVPISRDSLILYLGVVLETSWQNYEVYLTNFRIIMMNESIIYGLIIGAFSLIDLFQHNSYHVALKNPTHNLFQAHSRIEPVASLGI